MWQLAAHTPWRWEGRGAQERGTQASGVEECLLCFDSSVFSLNRVRPRRGRDDLSEDAGFSGKFRVRSRGCKGSFFPSQEKAAVDPPKNFAWGARTGLSSGSLPGVGVFAPRFGLWLKPEKLMPEA